MTTLNSELLIDSKILRENISYIKSKLENQTNFMSVIKSDAYGHNLELIIKDIDDISDGYGVVRIEEAIKIRKLSDKKILLMQGVYTDADYQLARENNLDLVVHNNDQFSLIRKHNNFNNLWLKVNTGMNRLGLEIDEFENIYENFLKNINFTLMTHLSSSNDKKSKNNAKQFRLFEELVSKLHSNVSLSIANTGCIMNFPDKCFDWVRCGIGIYGGYLDDENLKTAMTLRSPIVNIRKIKAGEGVGYDARAVSNKEMKIASVYLGYADGLPVTIKDGTKVLINDELANVFGKVSMDLTTIDVTNLDCKVGDWCEFFSPRLSISNIAKSNDLISYFLMTSVKSRVKKIYKNIK